MSGAVSGEICLRLLGVAIAHAGPETFTMVGRSRPPTTVAKIVPSRDHGHLVDGSLSPDSCGLGRMPVTTALGQKETSAYRIFLAGCLASSRQLLMKSCARGLMVRFFKMTMPTGAWPSDCLIGRTFNSGRLAENL